MLKTFVLTLGMFVFSNGVAVSLFIPMEAEIHVPDNSNKPDNKKRK